MQDFHFGKNEASCQVAEGSGAERSVEAHGMTPEGDGGREDEIHHGHGRGVPSSVILRVALPLISTQFSWAVQSAFATTLFKQLGATQRDLSYLRVPGKSKLRKKKKP